MYLRHGDGDGEGNGNGNSEGDIEGIGCCVPCPLPWQPPYVSFPPLLLCGWLLTIAVVAPGAKKFAIEGPD